MERKNIEKINEEFPNMSPDNCGSESVIFYLNGIVYKEFNILTPMEILKRKESKLLDLEQYPHLQSYYPNILYLVNSILDEYIRGYIMKPIYGTRISKVDLAFAIKMRALENLKNILNSFKKEGYLYLDVRHPNIRTDDNGNPTLLDIDSIIRIDNPILDCTPTDIKKYVANGGQITEHAQIFMFNKFTQDALQLRETEVDQTGARIINELKTYDADSAVDHEYLYEHIKKR